MKLPASWQMKRLEKLVQFSSGGTPSKAKPEFWQGDIPWISAATMHQQEIVTSDLHISEDGLKAGSKLAKENDLLLLVRGSMLWKKVPICICRCDVAFNQDVRALRINGKITPTYLLYWFLAHQRFLLNKVVGTGIGAGKFDLDELKALDIPFPPLPEQKAIADLLSTWDEAIEKTERLIQAKKKRFKCLLRELISESNKAKNNNRWNEVELGLICKVTKGKQLNVAHMNDDGAYYALNGGIAPSGRTDDWNTEAETITISEGGNSCGYVTYNTERFWSGGHCYSLLNLKKNVDRHYLYFYLKMNEPKLMKLRVGSGLPNIQKKDVDKFIVALPSLAEQQQIVQSLSSSQREIDLLKQLADKYKTQKRGLMQKMLTGEWRIKPEFVNQYMEA